MVSPEVCIWTPNCGIGAHYVYIQDFPSESIHQGVFISDGHRPYNADILAPEPSENDSPRTMEAYRILEQYVERPWRMQEFENALIGAADIIDEQFNENDEANPTDDEVQSEVGSEHDDETHSESEHDEGVAPAPPTDLADLVAQRLGDVDSGHGGAGVALVPEHINREEALDDYHNHPVALAAYGIFFTAIIVSVGSQVF